MKAYFIPENPGQFEVAEHSDLEARHWSLLHRLLIATALTEDERLRANATIENSVGDILIFRGQRNLEPKQQNKSRSKKETE
jgi:hypothetical protein